LYAAAVSSCWVRTLAARTRIPARSISRWIERLRACSRAFVRESRRPAPWQLDPKVCRIAPGRPASTKL
jgi:hypothetical protein